MNEYFVHHNQPLNSLYETNNIDKRLIIIIIINDKQTYAVAEIDPSLTKEEGPDHPNHYTGCPLTQLVYSTKWAFLQSVRNKKLKKSMGILEKTIVHVKFVMIKKKSLTLIKLVSLHLCDWL
ncbi:hypothetical protein DINM_001573 [Dirofilaria immitis]|nr:hypothetical protein [Dirofilaria immitis]